MSTYKTTGIIIKKRNFFETDRILTILTYDEGKIEAIAKGVRKILTRLGGHLDLFLETKIVLAEGRNFDIISSAETSNSFKRIRGDLKKTACAYFLAELVDKFSPLNQKNLPLFQLFKSSLNYLNDEDLNRQESELFIIYFVTHLLHLEGFLPELTRCVQCHQKLEGMRLYFSMNLGGIIDEGCAKHDQMVIPIDKTSIKLLRLLLHSDIVIIKKINITNRVIKETKKIILKYILYKSEKKINSEDFLKQIR